MFRVVVGGEPHLLEMEGVGVYGLIVDAKGQIGEANLRLGVNSHVMQTNIRETRIEQEQLLAVSVMSNRVPWLR